jgi:hypothetical protein
MANFEGLKTVTIADTEEIEKWHKAELNNLLDRVEKEVIGEDENYKVLPNNRYAQTRNYLKKEQRTALKKIRKSI